MKTNREEFSKKKRAAFLEQQMAKITQIKMEALRTFKEIKHSESNSFESIDSTALTLEDICTRNSNLESNLESFYVSERFSFKTERNRKANSK